MNRLRWIIVTLLVVLAPAAMLYPLWWNPLSAGEDDVLYYYPLRVMTGRALAEGAVPKDNSLELGGGAVSADPQAALGHPTTWLFAVLPPQRAYALSIFAAFGLAAGGSWLYLRRLGLHASASAIGALAFAMGGFMVGHRVHLAMITAAAMFPWVLWRLECLRACGSDRPLRQIAALTPLLLLAITAGHWPILIYMVLAWGVYLLLRVRPLGRGLVVVVAAGVLAGAMAAPQLIATAELMAQATRAKLGYAVAGENSFLLPSAVLAVYPMLMGSRTPDIFPQTWWGPWHLCEMLGYVGLVTLALAGSAVWRMYRKLSIADCRLPIENNAAGAVYRSIANGQLSIGNCQSSMIHLVRVWTWLAVGGFVWMLGYYLPTYWLIHALPVLGVVRCPARMVLVVDMALATLAAIAVHRAAEDAALRATIRRAVAWVLPGAMVLALAATAAMAYFVSWDLFWSLFSGDGRQGALQAVRLANPAVWVPWLVLAVTLLTVFWWLAKPSGRSAVLVLLLAADLFVVARSVDVPADYDEIPPPEQSPAAVWLAKNAPDRDTYRVWGVSSNYFDRAGELLLPKTAHLLGQATVNGYGPFQSPSHAHLLGFGVTGAHRDWRDLLRRNRLISLYGVRFILAADQEIRREIESIQVADPAHSAEPDGPNLLENPWQLEHAAMADGVLRFDAFWLYRPARAGTAVTLEAGEVYRIRLDARGPDGGAANYLRAEVTSPGVGWQGNWDQTGLAVRAEEIGPDWRHFEWTFTAPRPLPGPMRFEMHTLSERPIEVRNLSVRSSRIDSPVDAAGRLAPGEAVYILRTELPAGRSGREPVAIYENRLWQPWQADMPRPTATPDQIESLKWPVSADASHGWAGIAPDISLHAERPFQQGIISFTIPATAVWVLLVGISIWRRPRT